MEVKGEKIAKEKVDEVITAVYKVNLHCQQCARDIKKPLMNMQGVHNVDVDFQKAEIKVKGVIDVIKIHKQIEKWSKKKVEMVSPEIKIKNTGATEKKLVEQTKKAILRTTSIKVHMHCDKCENDLQNRLLKHEGIYSVKTNMKTQTLLVQGIIESDKLLAYIRKKVHKNAEIITSKPEKMEEKKEVKEAEIKEKQQVEAISINSTKLVEFKTEKKVAAQTTEGNAPYFIHYVYAPQLFSDENPNACIIM
ncbi:heavy metal-associated isoprenylated plant protein 4 [Ricinus communis]|uniref:heavy metal-associated isoprenylated plant protein 4 n=1 Tax=Ricinus communis TaxID=3988 RepID=UPI00201A48DD|nr:heavy metal-associated isoprenylated plant protein 4 [Ricinus communis]